MRVGGIGIEQRDREFTLVRMNTRDRGMDGESKNRIQNYVTKIK